MPFSQGLDSEVAGALDAVSLQVNAAAEAMAKDNPQVHVVDLYTLTAVSVVNYAGIFPVSEGRNMPPATMVVVHPVFAFNLLIRVALRLTQTLTLATTLTSTTSKSGKVTQLARHRRNALPYQTQMVFDR